MKVLVLGGTQFIGRHVVAELIRAGHHVTLLNRGKTAPEAFSQLPIIKADRTGDLSTLRELKQNWDAVIDLCGYFPKDVSHLLDVMRGYVGRYVFCSTVSVYATMASDQIVPMINEDSDLLGCTAEQAVDTTMATYGQRKAECERRAMKQHAAGIPVVIIRPSIVYGEHDHTDRFAYWISRASQNKPFLLPEDGLTITRRTYAPDLGVAFASSLTSQSVLGQAYNIAETDALNLRDTMRVLGRYFKTEPLEHAVSASADWLLKKNVKPWSDLPLWIPKTNLMIDTFKSRRDLLFVSTSSQQALAAAAEAFMKEGREPRAGLSRLAEEVLLKKITP